VEHVPDVHRSSLARVSPALTNAYFTRGDAISSLMITVPMPPFTNRLATRGFGKISVAMSTSPMLTPAWGEKPQPQVSSDNHGSLRQQGPDPDVGLLTQHAEHQNGHRGK
jgi:hypothetical protein